MWLEWTGTEGHIRRVRSMLRPNNARMVLIGPTVMLTEANSDHPAQGPWAQDVARQHNVKVREASDPGTLYQSACGFYFTTIKTKNYHQGHCNSCQSLPNPNGNGEVTTVFTVPGADTLEGLIEVMDGTMMQYMHIVDEYDNLIKALKNMGALEQQAKALDLQREEHRKAVSHFMEKEEVSAT
ncbi:hypothetical protein LCGC14_2508030 [marine sediment metagenome]|uniref:Uncharacterized protein n=1 Tax=marine sediment metagenome TaxID=412755 RepID=A0A0F9B0R4_9ZZZZ